MNKPGLVRLESVNVQLNQLRLEVNGIARANGLNVYQPISSNDFALKRVIEKIFEAEQTVKRSIEALKEDN
jgi:hypothetical protein